jgi:hypothetical protein
MSGPEEAVADFYVCPNHVATGGYESCCVCGGWDEDAEQGRLCTEALDAGHQRENIIRRCPVCGAGPEGTPGCALCSALEDADG